MKKVESRYSRTQDKNRYEEVVLLQGHGCFWKKCRFCDYYLDTDSSEEIIKLNKEVLNQVTGEPGWLTVINSGSYFELPQTTRKQIEQILIEKGIKDLTIEAHYAYRDQVRRLKERFKELGVRLHVRIGVETFNERYRENILKKGMGSINLDELSEVFDECCLLFGMAGQTIEDLIEDIRIATSLFDHVYLNIYEQRTDFPADSDLIEEFIETVYPDIKSISNLHILINNTDLGVG